MLESQPFQAIPAARRRAYLFLYVCQTVSLVSRAPRRVSQAGLTSNAEWQSETGSCITCQLCFPYTKLLRAPALRTHETPVSDSEEPCQWVEWNVASWALGVVVWRGQLRTGGVEAAAGHGRWEAGGGSGEHL